MKHLIFLLWCFCLPLVALAQGPGPTLPGLLENTEILYGALVIVWGYLAKFLGKYLPALDRVQTVFRVLAGGVVLAAAFITFGWGQVLPLLFSFLSALGVYDLFLKPMQKAFTNAG